MKLGIIGLPQSGKTTVFNALTGGDRPVGQMVGGGRFEVQPAVVRVPDARVDWLSEFYKPRKTIYAQVTYADIAGLEGAQSAFSGPLLNTMAQMDGYLHVVRGFDDDNVPHPFGSVDPERDERALDDELLLNDLLAVERKLERLEEERSKGGGRERNEIEYEQALFGRLQAVLEKGQPLRQLDLAADEIRLLSGFGLLTLKPKLTVVNVSDDDAGGAPNAAAVSVRGRLEMEIAQLEPEDARMFLEEYGLTEPSLNRMIRLSYELLQLRSFFTVGEDEVRAWTIRSGAVAPQAAGAIHSDMEAGFIRAEVFTYDDLREHGSEAAVKAAGKWRLEGKEYCVQDGDILSIRFSPAVKK